MLRVLHIVAVYGTMIAAAQQPPGATFGTGLAGIPICGTSRPATVVVNYTLDAAHSHGVMHHFWSTGAQFKIDRMWVDYYIDGEANASVSYQPSMACGQAFPEQLPKTSPLWSAGGLCGKTAPVGGWWNTFPIPFYKSVLVTVRADPSDGPGCFGGYVNLRGTPGLPLVLPQSGIPLPPGTKLQLQHNPMALRQPLEYVTLGSLPAGTKGLVFQSTWAVQATPVGGTARGGGYIEGCWQFYRRANESFPGLVVGTGVEDYFDSGYYFGADSGQPVGTPFQNPLSGLTMFERDAAAGVERLSAYRFHTADPLVMDDGGRLVWRVGAQGQPGTTKCGNPLPSDSAVFPGPAPDRYEPMEWAVNACRLFDDSCPHNQGCCRLNDDTTLGLCCDKGACVQSSTPNPFGGYDYVCTNMTKKEHTTDDFSAGQLGRTLSAVNVTTSLWIYVFP